MRRWGELPKCGGNNGEGRSKEPHSSHQRLETATSTAFLKTSTFWSLDTDWLSDAVAAKTEKLTLGTREFAVADLKAMAKELRELGWIKEDYSDRVDKYVDLTYLAKATGH